MASTRTWDDGPPIDEVPPDSWFDHDEVPADWPAADVGSRSRRHPRHPTGRTVAHGAKVLAALRRVLAAYHGRPADELRQMIAQLRTSPKALAELDETTAWTYRGVFEVLEVECANLTDDAPVYLGDLPGVDNHTAEVADELARIVAVAARGDAASNPYSAWLAVVEDVQGAHTLRGLHALARAIEEKAPAEHKLELFRRLEPPTTKAAVVREAGPRTAREVVEERAAALAGAAKLRFSSGYRTLDLAFTGPGEPVGFIAPGEQSVIGGPTGTGKSSFSYALVRSFAQDLVNWGYQDGYVVWFHTEEESADKVRAAGLGPGQRFHHLADRVVIDPIGTSRRRMAEVLYDLVIAAEKKSQQSGLPPTRFLPHVVLLDYIQAVAERNESDNQANIVTAEFLLRGVQAWNPEEMAKFSGLDFRAYAGMPWPDGMDHHRCAVVTFAQLKKPDDESLMFFKSGSRKHKLSDFAFEHTDASVPAPWTDEGGGAWSWEVREQDLYLLKQNQIMGSSKILQNATTILLLHRSRPRNNPRLPGVGADGRPHLEDTRARLLLDKTRAGSQLKFVPMAFDIMADGFRAQYYDVLAEAAIDQGRFRPDPAFIESGDPILPRRPAASPLAGLRY